MRLCEGLFVDYAIHARRTNARTHRYYPSTHTHTLTLKM
jgi:hypothetical protein